MDPDLAWMQQALSLADEAEAAGEVPVAALVVLDGEVIGRGFNRCIAWNDPSAHAEIVALRDAGQRKGNYRLQGASVYITLEPCPMCAGAMVHARVARVVFAAFDPKTGAAGSVFDTLVSPRHLHPIEVRGGILGDLAGERLRTFFRARRGQHETPT